MTTIISKAVVLFTIALFSSMQAQSQSLSHSLLAGDTAVLSVTGVVGNFQWQQSTDSLTWTNISGATNNPQEIITSTSPTGYLYFRANVIANTLCGSHVLISSNVKIKIVSSTSQIQVGDYFHGGIVFHTEGTGEGLIAPLNDLGKFLWGCLDFSTNATNATDGAINTITILNNCSERPIAASVCDTSTLNGYSDWFLPSKDQLSWLHQNRNLFGPFQDDSMGFGGYWSSTEFNSRYACFYWFQVHQLQCGFDCYDKSNNKSVRCVRNYDLMEINSKANYVFTITIPPVFQDEEICFVTVDTAVGKNKIIWKKTPNVGTESYKIYKETGLNDYSLIGTVPYDLPSFLIDNSSQPESHGDKYKISVVDTCGYESDLSYFHKTINLTIAVNGTTMGLNWDDYVDESGVFVPGKFYIFRGSNIHNLTLYDSISASFHSYNDVNITTSYYYMIGTKKTTGCIIDTSSTNVIFSNKKQNYSIGVNEMGYENYLNISPNPFNDYTTISINSSNQSKYSITIFDITGKVMRTYKNMLIDKLKIEKGELKSGIYFIDIIGDRTIRGKLIVE
jgi:hypothetical protein